MTHPLDWPYRDKFNNALLELQEQGVLARLKNKWWNEIGAGVCGVSFRFAFRCFTKYFELSLNQAKSADDGPSRLGIKNLSGIYLVLIVGSILAFIFSFLYWCLFVYKKAKFYEVFD